MFLSVSRGIRAYCRKKGHKWDFSEKGQNIVKLGQKCTKFENILKKGSLIRANVACMKQPEYALVIERDHWPEIGWPLISRNAKISFKKSLFLFFLALFIILIDNAVFYVS